MENIVFRIGQPNTGKSYGFDKKTLEKEHFGGQEIKYLNIPVSGGIGNEYKGLQNTDLAITYDPINETIRFGDFLKHLMRAIVDPETPYVVFLDDFHNQDISSLLSEYTPLFKKQQRRDLRGKITKPPHYPTSEEYEEVEKFIEEWNAFIDELHKEDNNIPVVPITNRISGSALKLVFPANFYLLGAANFNEKTLNIFADWADRAQIEIVDPIEVQESEALNKKIDEDTKEFAECCKQLNETLKDVLAEESIFDYEKYCFGIWKIVEENGKIVSDTESQREIVRFIFSMIKNSLIYNNKNSYVNTVGWKLIQRMKEDRWFKEQFAEELYKNEELLNEDLGENDDTDKKIFKLLHSMKIYDN